MKKYVAALIAVILIALFFPGTASAHHPEVSGVAVCSDTGSLVTITAEAWANPEPIRRVNNSVSIAVFLNGAFTTVGLGAFNDANNYTFTATTTVSASLGSVLVRATSLVDWGPSGEFGSAGEFREATVQLPSNCANVPPTTAPPTTTTVPPVETPPTTTIRATTTTSTTTIAPTTTVAPPTTGPSDAQIIERKRLAETDRFNEPVLIFLALCVFAVGVIFIFAKPREV